MDSLEISEGIAQKSNEVRDIKELFENMSKNIKTFCEVDDNLFKNMEIFRKERRRFERIFEDVNSVEIIDELPKERTNPHLLILLEVGRDDARK